MCPFLSWFYKVNIDDIMKPDLPFGTKFLTHVPVPCSYRPGIERGGVYRTRSAKN